MKARSLAVTFFAGIGFFSFATAHEAMHGFTNWYEVRGGAWPVAQSIVKEMRNSLQSAAHQAIPMKGNKSVRLLANDTIQYQGQANEHGKQVLLQGACHTDGKSGKALVANWHLVLDGGDCYYSAVYDPAMKKFISFYFHGNA